MSSLSPALPRRTGLVSVLSALGGAVVVLAVIGAMHLAGGSSDARPAAAAKATAAAQPQATTGRFTAAGNAFTLDVPRGWSAVRGSDPGSPAAILRRPDGRGLVVVRRIPDLTGDLRTVARSMTARLRAELPGFRLVSARIGRVRAGAAFLYTFARGSSAEAIAVTRVKGATFRIDSVVAAGSPAAAREAGAAVGSFGP